MCVLIHTARKSLLKRFELQAAMRNNSSGFFIAELLPDKTRHVIRTLSAIDAQRFWDDIPETSEVVMHFRIPSRGPTTLDNVHGWEQNKILFGHNRTLTNLFPLMDEESWRGTDSEYFFKRIFIPMYRKFGHKAYRDGQLHPLIDHTVRAICGDYNKFLFVMPDNKVIRYGKWEGDDTDRPDFHASNKSYQTSTDTSKVTWAQKLRELFNLRKYH